MKRNFRPRLSDSSGAPNEPNMKRKKHPTGSMGRHKRPEKIYEFNEADSRLYDIFRNHDFGDYPHDKRHQLVRFYQLLMEKQNSDNFTRLIKFRDIAIKHFIDSLIVVRLTQLQFPLLDMGTGPGFPGIPLKIEFPDEKIILADGVRKRIDFLKHVREEMGLKNLDLMGRNITEDFTYPVQGVITRAVEDISLTLKNVSQCLPIGGRLYLMKGPSVDDELAAAKARWKDYYKLIEDHTYRLPETPHERRLIVFEKIAIVKLEAAQ
jgi:16S rRNA (guanine527-N7)-methyltransferase